MDKRYQVFVSSTYEDLQEERHEVMQALLELDCIPAGMELFPASNEDQWSLIKRIIDDSDYYIVIIGGRYGSTNESGISYTEMEYRYAVEMEKPIIAFLHKKPEDIKSKYTEQSPDGRGKLELFRTLAQKKMVKYWSSSSELGSVVSRSMVKLMKQFPATGWVRADNISDEISMREIFKLKQENEELKNQLHLSKITAPIGSEKLAQGEDSIAISLNFIGITRNYAKYELAASIITTWNDLFSIISPYMVIECKEKQMKLAITAYLKKIFEKEPKYQITDKKYSSFSEFEISNEEFQNIKIQFKALGLIAKSTKNRSVKDTASYWTLTDYGDYIMTQLIAVKKVKATL